MRGPFALQTEVFGSFHDADAKVELPDAIDEDAAGEGIGSIDEPAGQVEAGGPGTAGRASSGTRRVTAQRRQLRGRVRFNRLTGFVVLAAHENACFTRR